MKTNNIPIGQAASLYESPALAALDIESEGLLCQSGGGVISTEPMSATVTTS